MEKKEGHRDRKRKLKEEDEVWPQFYFTRTDEWDEIKVLRHVEPYVYSFKTYAKERWYGQKVGDVFKKEFGGFSISYFDSAFPSGRITVNDTIVSPDYLLQAGDLLCHHTHRHEAPINGQHIDIILETKDIVVVNKPSTVPCHPCGSYRYNSLPYLLCWRNASNLESNSLISHEQNGVQSAEEPTCVVTNSLKPPDPTLLHVVHRLDRLTSGVLILAKTVESARQYANDIQGKFTQKTYLARVDGKFGDFFDERWRRESLDSDDSVGWCYCSGPSDPSVSEDKRCSTGGDSLGGKSGDTCKSDGTAGSGITSWVRVQQPIRCVSHKNSSFECAIQDPSVTTTSITRSGTPSAKTCAPAKNSVTLFRLLSHDSGASIVECRPLTGRTHQIRLHLQFMNHPIGNDPSYGKNSELQINNQGAVAESSTQDSNINLSSSIENQIDITSSVRFPNEDLESYLVRTCERCQLQFGGDPTALIAKDTHESDCNNLGQRLLYKECIWLHAWRYSMKCTEREWSFEAPLPAWASLEMPPKLLCEERNRTPSSSRQLNS